MASKQEVTPETLRIYYERLFPCRDFCRWLCYREDGPGGKAVTRSPENEVLDEVLQAGDGGGFLFRREFSFTLPGDIYCRYLSFHGQHDFRKALLDRVPDKIDIGAVFNIPPTNYQQFGLTGGSGGGFHPQQRELVFDIDMDDYDEVRRCCSGSNVCKLCWTFIACAVKILDKALREDFGFKHIMFVFSGRRGVHCWVCDESARKLSNDQRSAVAEYLQLLNGGRCKYIRSSTQQRHPHVRRAVEVCHKYLEMPGCGLLEGQQLLGAPPKEEDKELLQKIVNAAIPASDPVGRAEAKSFLSSKRTSLEVVWAWVDEAGRDSPPDTSPISRQLGVSGWMLSRFVVDVWQWLSGRASSVAMDEISLELAYPRLDINVSKQMNHLLKAPFCIHPKTGRVCVPLIDVNKPESFDPLSVPTVADLYEELAAQKENAEKHTSLSRYLSFFKKFVEGVEADVLGEKRDLGLVVVRSLRGRSMTGAISKDKPYSPSRYLSTVRWVNDSVVAELMNESQAASSWTSPGSPARPDASPAGTPHNTPPATASSLMLLASGPPVSTLNPSDRSLAALQLGRRAALESRKYVVNCLMHSPPQKATSHQVEDILPWAIQRLETFDEYCDDLASREARESDVEQLRYMRRKRQRSGSTNNSSSTLEIDPQSASGQVSHLYSQLAEATEQGRVVASVPEKTRKMIRKRVSIDSVELVSFELMCLCMLQLPNGSSPATSDDSDSDGEEGGVAPKEIEDRVWFLLERKCGQLGDRQGQLWERVHLASLAACAVALFVKCYAPMTSDRQQSESEDFKARAVVSATIAKPPPERILLYGGRAVVGDDRMVEVTRAVPGSGGVVVREAVRRRTFEEPYEHLLLLEDLERALHGNCGGGDPHDQLSAAASRAAASSPPPNLVGWTVVDENEDDEDDSRKQKPCPAYLSVETEGRYCDFNLVHGASALVSEETIKEVMEDLPASQAATLSEFLEDSEIHIEGPEESLGGGDDEDTEMRVGGPRIPKGFLSDEYGLLSLVNDTDSDESVKEGGVKQQSPTKASCPGDAPRFCGVCGGGCDKSSTFTCKNCAVSIHDECRNVLGWSRDNTARGLCLACSHSSVPRMPTCMLCPCKDARRSVLMPEGESGHGAWCHLLCCMSFSGVSIIRDSLGYLRVVLGHGDSSGRNEGHHRALQPNSALPPIYHTMFIQQRRQQRTRRYVCGSCGLPVVWGQAQVRCCAKVCRRRFHAICAPNRVDRFLKGAAAPQGRRKKGAQPLLYTVVSCAEHAIEEVKA
ncbi:hypothetical protein FOL47_005703 [Perkinsus chesapeaki]|uniref:DNA primase n=1 Tax=Perkinsus chesapeaki TaxID=330153 RepID=A0A7J6LW49_PERCH|nr:hypothetical protein FOL47_005703 [Perkinsus chesapeaki]